MLPWSPWGIVRFRTGAAAVPVIVAAAWEPAAPVVTVPIEKAGVAPVSPVAPFRLSNAKVMFFAVSGPEVVTVTEGVPVFAPTEADTVPNPAGSPSAPSAPSVPLSDASHSSSVPMYPSSTAHW